MTEAYFESDLSSLAYTNADIRQAEELIAAGKVSGWCPECHQYYTILDEHTGETKYYATPQNAAQKIYRVLCLSCIRKQYPL